MHFFFNTAACFGTPWLFISTGSFARIEAIFEFRRRRVQFVWSVFIPGVVLVILSWLGFFITPEAVPARVYLGITTVLSVLVLRNTANNSMPKATYMKAADIFLVTLFGYVFAALTEYIVVLNTTGILKKFLENRLGRANSYRETRINFSDMEIEVGQVFSRVATILQLILILTVLI